MKYRNVTLGRVEAVWNKLGGEEGVAKFLSGLTEVVPVNRVIDCDVVPPLDIGVKVVEHQKCGRIAWDGSKVRLHLSESQTLNKNITGHELHKELQSYFVLNASVLFYLLDNPHLIPEEWKESGQEIYFWGTIHNYDDDEDLSVLYLKWLTDEWGYGSRGLDSKWGINLPAAVLEK